MANYVYDEYRLTLVARADGSYEALGVGGDGLEHRGTFELPFDGRELERLVLGVARQTATRSVTRDIGGASVPTLDAEQLGGALASALLVDDMAAGYDVARRAAASSGRGLRLTLSLGDAPALLGVPWELLYRPPTFLANQRQTPIVRHLAVPDLPDPPAIDGAVRILGVVANPPDTAPLDVAAERSRVERAVADVVAAGLVTLDWLEPATPRRLREALRDGTYHVLHYIGHGDFTPEGEGVLYLDAGPEVSHRQHTELDRAELASLLADQTSLRLVVLNSCEGARTSLTDPFAGVATALVQLGVPAVVAMQFEISDAAAVLFAEELYTNLIGRRTPIDAAVSEARKAIFIEQGTVEWATPVLFMAETDVELFRFAAATDAPATDTPPDETGRSPTPRPRRRARPLIVALGLAIALSIGAGIWVAIASRSEDETASELGASSISSSAPSATARPASTAPAEPTQLTARTLSGSIDAADELEAQPIELTAGQAIYLRGASACGPGVAYRLLSPSGTQVSGQPTVCQDIGRVDIGQTGTWTVEAVSDLGGTGPYSIELLPITTDTDVPIERGQRVEGEITERGARSRYRFSANAGDIVYVKAGPSVSSPCEGVAYQLLTPTGDQLAGYPYGCSDTDRTVLPATGEYTISVESYVGATGRYDLQLLAVPEDVTTPIEIGASVSGEITSPGQRFRYPFDAAARTLVAVDASTTCGANVEYWIESPSGVVVGGVRPYVCDDLAPQELTETGTHALVVSSWIGGIGAFDLRVYPVS